ncbi:hypothetical protein [Tabrizicola sp.]|uniref:hypothetical protein n=1 Tax=Tabrizicola sp. TaxID=2005166 RepID=UPI001A38C24F|nr:hypothetical protein [Tabrizicola sp.]MBL9061115.1 hypothetical protein [Tabrizicola sp.]
MERRFQTGTVVSAAGHLGVILWVLVGDWLFAADVPPETITMQVSTISSDQFAELQAATETPAEEPAAVKPRARPEEVVEPPPEEPPPDVTPPEEPPVDAPPPVEVVPDEVTPEPVVTPPPSDAVQAEEEQAIQSDSTEIQPAPEAEAIIAPDPVQPESDAETADTAAPAVSEDPAADVVVEEQPTEATVPEDTGDVTQTEANQDQTAETGMTTSIRPKSRPEKPAAAPEPEVAADEPAESTHLTVQPVDDAETQDAIDALLGEASEEPVTEDVASDTAADTGGQDLPQGPPLTGGEMGNISSAIARRWNLGAASTDVMSTMVRIQVSFSPDGKPLEYTLLSSSGPNQAAIDNLFAIAKRAVNRTYSEGGIPLPPDKYDTWRVLNLTFDANGMRVR